MTLNAKEKISLPDSIKVFDLNGNGKVDFNGNGPFDCTGNGLYDFTISSKTSSTAVANKLFA